MRTLSSFAIFFQRTSIATALSLGASFAAYAQTPAIDVKIIGVSYLEAPPGRDKNVAAFGAGSTLEKVEINAIAQSKSRQFAEAATSVFDKGDVKVTAVFSDKSTQALGNAEMSGFPKYSSNGLVRSFNLSVNRLPDRAVSGLIFEGIIPLTVAKGINKAEAVFDPTKISEIKLGASQIKTFKIDGQSLEIKGNDTLTNIKTLSLKLPNGQIVNAERGSWGQMNNEYAQTWKFSAPIARGTLQADLYDGLENIKHPVRLVIGRPW